MDSILHAEYEKEREEQRKKEREEKERIQKEYEELRKKEREEEERIQREYEEQRKKEREEQRKKKREEAKRRKKEREEEERREKEREEQRKKEREEEERREKEREEQRKKEREEAEKREVERLYNVAVLGIIPESRQKNNSETLETFVNDHLTIRKVEDCSVCLNEQSLFEMGCCTHAFCKNCINNLIQLNNPICPLCRASFHRIIRKEGDKNINSIINEPL